MSLISEGYGRGFTVDWTWYYLCVFQRKVRKIMTTQKLVKISATSALIRQHPEHMFRKDLLPLFAPNAVTAFTASKALDDDS
ncbi:hypothetical protein N7448_002360 [Penicillium atrosanguineum]|nr:hypothetical protein N7448_002360 [Penicillium atrosanguineum]